MRNDILALRRYNKLLHAIFGRTGLGKGSHELKDLGIYDMDCCWECGRRIYVWNSAMFHLPKRFKVLLANSDAYGDSKFKNAGITCRLLCEDCIDSRVSRRLYCEDKDKYLGTKITPVPLLFFLVSTNKLRAVVKNSGLSCAYLAEITDNENFRKKVNTRTDGVILTEMEYLVILEKCVRPSKYTENLASTLLLEANKLNYGLAENMNCRFLSELSHLIRSDKEAEEHRNDKNHFNSIPLVGFTLKHSEYSHLFADYGIYGELYGEKPGGKSYDLLKAINYQPKRVSNHRATRLTSNYSSAKYGYSALDRDLFVWPSEWIIINSYLKEMIPEYKEPSLVTLLRANLTLDYQKGYEF